MPARLNFFPRPDDDSTMHRMEARSAALGVTPGLGEVEVGGVGVRKRCPPYVRLLLADPTPS